MPASPAVAGCEHRAAKEAESAEFLQEPPLPANDDSGPHSDIGETYEQGVLISPEARSDGVRLAYPLPVSQSQYPDDQG